MYADFDYYKNEYRGELEQNVAEKALAQASRHIDTLTFCRVRDKGFDELTDFQQEVVKESCCMMADFETANADLINSLLNSYSLNGASMAFNGNGANCTTVDGVVVQKDVYSYLEQSGLCCRSLGV